jgi:hypothetical protein
VAVAVKAELPVAEEETSVEVLAEEAADSNIFLLSYYQRTKSNSIYKKGKRYSSKQRKPPAFLYVTIQKVKYS